MLQVDQRDCFPCCLLVGQSHQSYSAFVRILHSWSVQMLQAGHWHYRSVFPDCNPLDAAPDKSQFWLLHSRMKVLTSKEKFLYGCIKLIL